MRIASLAALAALIVLPSTAFAQSTAPAAPAPAEPATTVPSARPDIAPEVKARYEAFRAVCGADLQTHCANVARGTESARGEMRQCIATHKAKFSTACQAAVAERDAARDARKSAAAEKAKS
jgi:hypothetical protein